MEDQPIVNEEPVIEVPEAEEVVTEPAPLPGQKTESVLLLESLQKERERRRIAEEELEALRNKPEGEYTSDEGKLLKAEIDRLAKQLENSSRNDQLATLRTSFPALKDKAQEFENYLEENKGMKLEVAAKAFLVENNLFESPAPRRGLERDTGGTRTPVKTGRTEAEVSELRKNNYRQYEKELRAGTLWN